MSERTEIFRSVDKSKCPNCGSDDIAYFEEEESYWCAYCHKVYQFEDFEKDDKELEEPEIEEWTLVEEN